MKICFTCKVEKENSEFSFRKESLDKMTSSCKECHRAKSKVLYFKHQEKKLAYAKKYREQHKELVLQRTKAWRAKSFEAIKEYTVKYRTKNAEHIAKQHAENKRLKKHTYAYLQKTREAKKRQAIPNWANIDEMKMWYSVSSVLSRSGINFVVDHIVPIISDKVCGFHSQDNMQILVEYQNLSKGNRYWPNMPSPGQPA